MRIKRLFRPLETKMKFSFKGFLVNVIKSTFFVYLIKRTEEMLKRLLLCSGLF